MILFAAAQPKFQYARFIAIELAVRTLIQVPAHWIICRTFA